MALVVVLSFAGASAAAAQQTPPETGHAYLHVTWQSTLPATARRASIEREGECEMVDSFSGRKGQTISSRARYFEVDQRVTRRTVGGKPWVIVDYDVVYSTGYTVDWAAQSVSGPTDTPFELDPLPGAYWTSGLRRSNLGRNGKDLSFTWTHWPIDVVRQSFQVQSRDGAVVKITGPSKPKDEFAHCQADFRNPARGVPPKSSVGPEPVHTQRWIRGTPWLNGEGELAWDFRRMPDWLNP